MRNTTRTVSAFILPAVLVYCLFFWIIVAIFVGAQGQTPAQSVERHQTERREDYRDLYNELFPFRGYARACVLDENGAEIACRAYQTRDVFQTEGACQADVSRRVGRMAEIARRDGYGLRVSAICRRDRTVHQA